MNKIKIFAVFDSAVGAYLHPMFFQSKGQALRAWMDAANDPNSQFAKHPSDFTLFEIGEYDEVNGSIISYSAKVSLGTALELRTRPLTTPEATSVASDETGATVSELRENSRDNQKRIRQAVETHTERNS